MFEPKVLIVKTSSMGDIIHTLPALTDAEQIFPHISFDWIVEEDFVEILPKLNLTSIATILKHAAGVVAVDTGLGHISAALGVSSVSLYRDTNPILVGAYGENQVHVKMSAVNVDDVWQILLENNL